MIQSARIHGVLASVFYPPSRKNSNGFRLKAGLETRSFPNSLAATLAALR